MTPRDDADEDDAELLSQLLRRAQVEGALGAAPITEVIAHARGFVAALPDSVGTVLDLGTGAGVPGLVIALDRPAVRVTLVDRRAKRIDALQRAITALGWGERVTAVAADAETLADDPQWQGKADAVVARGFGPPATTLRVAARLTHPGGWVVISEPPADQPSRWEPDLLASCGVSHLERLGAVARFHVERRSP
ncbi:MAG: RsmG family class I SAM-dependent methyltransferase [Actinomycetota bacterium]